LEIYKNSFDISRNGTFELWNCKTGTANPKGTVWYYIVYDVFYCNDASYSTTHKFYVNYPSSKSSTEAPDETETPETLLSPPVNIITPQEENAPPTFTILPNPNPGTFQLETNFPLFDIAILKITNMLGATVYEVQQVTSNTIQLPASASGQHFVIIFLKDGALLTQKMMLQH
jgi:hypothetical protein